MLKLFLLILRVVLIAAPGYNLYEFVSQGEGAGQGPEWWIANAGFIVWALGPYIILYFASHAVFINGAQVFLLMAGAGGLAYFFFTPDIYGLFLELPIFEGDNKVYLPVIPYAYCVAILALASLAKTRRRKAGQK